MICPECVLDYKLCRCMWHFNYWYKESSLMTKCPWCGEEFQVELASMLKEDLHASQCALYLARMLSNVSR